MGSVTILYYTSNQEDEDFERKVQLNILKYYQGLPIISVSQKPIHFGDKNICVGEVGASGYNMFRQVLIGCEAATTDFILSTESDCLYPPDYFEFVPPKLDVCYRTSNLYVMPDRRPYFFSKKEGATHAQIVGRKYYINRLKELFGDGPKWSIEEKNFPKERHRKEDVFDKIEHYEMKNPVVQIKTHRGMRYYTSSDRTPIHNIEFWGNGKELRKAYL